MNLQGFRIRVKIAGHAFAVGRFSFSDEVPDLDVSNSEGYQGYAGEIGLNPNEIAGTNNFTNSTYGQAKATVELEQATLIQATNGNPFLDPFTLYAGKWVKLEIYPNRQVNRKHLVQNAMITKISHTGQVTALQPLTLTLVSDGKYLNYTAQAAININETSRFLAT